MCPPIRFRSPSGVDRSGVGGGMPTSSVRGGGPVSLPARSRGFDLQVSSFAFVVVVSPFLSSAVQTLMGQVSVSLLLSVGQRGADAARARPGARDRRPSTTECLSDVGPVDGLRCF